MPMRPCNNCLENQWTFQKLDDGFIKATCKLCGYDVEWEPKDKPQNKFSDGQACACGGILKLTEAKITAKKLRKSYYYTAYHQCTKCKKVFYSDKFKTLNKNYESQPKQSVLL